MAREELNMKRQGADPVETLYPLLSFSVPQLGDRGVSSAADRCDFLPLLISDLSACMDLLSTQQRPAKTTLSMKIVNILQGHMTHRSVESICALKMKFMF